MQTLFTFCVCVVLLVYWRMDVRREEENVRVSLAERDEGLAVGADIRTGVFVVGLFLMMHFALQSRDGVMHRPHPIVWRCVHGAGVLYVMLLPFKACCAGCVPVIDIVYEGVLLPLVCAENAVNGTPMC